MRFLLGEVTPGRIYNALKRRIHDIPVELAWRQSPLAKANAKRLEQYRNLHLGERCFIIANGPSLKHMDLSPLAGERTISMNRAYLMYESWGFIPTYFTCINELVLRQFHADITNLPMPKFLNFSERESFRESEADERLMFLRMGMTLRDKFGPDCTHSLSSGGTVTFASLQLAYFMGFKEVVLIGLDHSFVEKGTPNKAVVRHQEKDESHCHPDYFPKGIKWELPDLYRSELAYALARQAFEADGRRILDATRGGLCTVFEKVDFGEALLRPISGSAASA